MGSRPCASPMPVSPQLNVRRIALPRVLRRRPVLRGDVERWQKSRSKRLSRTAAAQHSFRGEGRAGSKADPLRNYVELGSRVPFVEGSPQQRKRSQSVDDSDARVVVAAAAVQELRSSGTNLASTSSSSSIVVLREGEASDWRKWEEAFEDAKEKEALLTALQLIPRSESLSRSSKRMVDLVAAWDRLSSIIVPPTDGRDGGAVAVVLAALKLAMPALEDVEESDVAIMQFPESSSTEGRGGRVNGSSARQSGFQAALSVAMTLAHLKMEPSVIAAAVLKPAIERGTVSIPSVESLVGPSVAHLLRDCLRLHRLPSRLDSLDDDTASAARHFCLSFHDPRSLLTHIASQLHFICALPSSPTPHARNQIHALHALQLWAPLAHTLGIGSLTWQMEDRALQVLFPHAYESLKAWREEMWPQGGSRAIERARERLQMELEGDEVLASMVEGVAVMGRAKSLYSMMKKIVKDGRDRHEVNDLLGLRVVVTPRRLEGVRGRGRGATEAEEQATERLGEQACYRVKQVAARIWREAPGRVKDYIAAPKKNGYRSLHCAVEVPLPDLAGEKRDGRERRDGEVRSQVVEIQIRTALMDREAEGGMAAHGMYKGGGGVTAEQMHQLQLSEIMAVLKTAAKAASVSLDLLPSAGADVDLNVIDKQGSVVTANGAVAEGRRTALPAWTTADESSSSSSRERKEGRVVPFSLGDTDSVDGAVRERLHGTGDANVRDMYGLTEERGVESGKGEGEGEVDPIFAMLDANGDGVISVEEMREFMRELGTPLPSTINGEVKGLDLQGAGADRRDVLMSSSWSAGAAGSGSDGSGTREGQEEWEAARQLVALMDANTDGTVCAKEFAEFRRQVRLLHRLRQADQSMQSEVERRRMREGVSGTQGPAAPAQGSSGDDDGGDAQPVASDMLPLASSPLSSEPAMSSSNALSSLALSPTDPSQPVAVAVAVSSPVEAVLPSTDTLTPLAPPSPPPLSTTKASASVLSPSRPVMLKQHTGASTSAEIDSPPPLPLLTHTSSLQLAPSSLASSPSSNYPGWQAGGTLARQRQAMAAAGTAAAVSAALLAERDAMRVGVEERERVVAGEGGLDGLDSVNSGIGRRGSAASHASIHGIGVGEGEGDELVSIEEVKEALKSVRSLLSTKKQKDMTTARKVLGRLLVEHPKDPRVFAHVAQLEHVAGSISLARVWYERSVQQYVHEHRAATSPSAMSAAASGCCLTLQAWGRMEASERHLSTARKLFQHALHVVAVEGEEEEEEWGARDRRQSFSPSPLPFSLSLSPSHLSAACLHSWAVVERRAGCYSEARSLLLTALDCQPGNAVVLQSLALLEADVHNWREARRLFERACEADPGDVACWQAWALMEARQGNHERMRELFQAAVKVDSRSAHALQAWANEEARMATDESREAARSLFRRCLQVSPHSLHALQAWAVMEYNANDITAARRLFQQCLSLAPTSVPALQALAVLEWKSGDVEAARRLLDRALAEGPTNAATLMVAAQLEEAAGNSSRAADLFVRKNLSDRAAARRRRRLFESKKEMVQGEKEEAREEGRGGRRRRRKGRKQASRTSMDNNLISGVDYVEGGSNGGLVRQAVSDSETFGEGGSVNAAKRGDEQLGRRTPRGSDVGRQGSWRMLASMQ